MMSPIGQYLTEFRTGGVPDVVPLRFSATPDSVIERLDFGAVERACSTLDDGSDAQAESDGDQIPIDDPEHAAEVPSGIAFETAIEALKAEHAAELTAARHRWAETEGTALAARIAQGFGDLENQLADTLAPIVEPFLAKAAQVKVLDQLRDTIRTLLADADQRIVTVSGPEDLIAGIKQAYPGPSALVFQTADAPDISIAMGDTRARSQLRSWARKLDAALGAQA